MNDRVHVVISTLGGIVDRVQVYGDKLSALSLYRELIRENSPFTRKEIIDIHSDNKEEFDRVWQKDSDLYVYDATKDCYYPTSTEDHDVFLYEELLN